MPDLIRRINACLQRLLLGLRTGRHCAVTTAERPVTTPGLARSQEDRPTSPPPVALRPGPRARRRGERTRASVLPFRRGPGERAVARRLALALAADLGLDLDLHVVGAQAVAA